MRSQRPLNEDTTFRLLGFRTILREHYASVARYVARRLPEECLDDVVSATFTVAWRKYDQVEAPNLLWLYRIASYEVAHERRRLARHPQRVIAGDLELTDTHPLEEVIDLVSAFSQLSEPDAELLRLVIGSNWSESDVLRYSAARSIRSMFATHRAKDRLATAIKHSRNFDEVSKSTKEQP